MNMTCGKGLHAFAVGALMLMSAASACADAAIAVTLFPAHGATGVNPDTPLRLGFPSPPALGTRGAIRVVDAVTAAPVDRLDMSIPPGPRNTRTRAPYDSLGYAVTPTARAMSGRSPTATSGDRSAGRARPRRTTSTRC